MKDLLKHKFIAKAKKTSALVEYIEKYRKWKANKTDDGDGSDSDEDKEDKKEKGEVEDPDWNFGTVRGPSGSNKASGASGSSSAGNGAGGRKASGPLESVIIPSLEKLRERYAQPPSTDGSSGGQENNPQAISELVAALRLAEKNKPGYIQQFVNELAATMAR